MQKSGILCQVDGTFPNKRVFVMEAEKMTRGKESRERAGREAGREAGKSRLGLAMYLPTTTTT